MADDFKKILNASDKLLFQRLNESSDPFSASTKWINDTTPNKPVITNSIDDKSKIENYAKKLDTKTINYLNKKENDEQKEKNPDFALASGKMIDRSIGDRDGDGDIDEKDQEIYTQQQREARAKIESSNNSYQEYYDDNYTYTPLHEDMFISSLVKSLVDNTNKEVEKNIKNFATTIDKQDVKENLVLREGETEESLKEDYNKNLSKSFEDLLKDFDKAVTAGSLKEYLKGVDYLNDIEKNALEEYWKGATEEERKALFDKCLQRTSDCNAEAISVDFVNNAKYLKEQKISTHYCTAEACKPITDFESRAKLIEEINNRIATQKQSLQNDAKPTKISPQPISNTPQKTAEEISHEQKLKAVFEQYANINKESKSGQPELDKNEFASLQLKYDNQLSHENPNNETRKLYEELLTMISSETGLKNHNITFSELKHEEYHKPSILSANSENQEIKNKVL